MRALVFDGSLRFRDDYPSPRRNPGESLIEVDLAGVCATDLEIVKGYMGFRGIPGHEFVGRVVESDREDLRGMRVVGEINCPCGACDLCNRGLGNHCRARTVLGIQGKDGAFAEYLTLPDRNLHAVPAGVTDRQAVFAEPLAAACRAFDHANLAEGERAVVLGDGRLGLLIAMVFRAEGRSVTLVGKHERKLELARSAGIHVLRLSEAGEVRGADAVVDASGDASGLECALDLVRPAGRIVLKTTIASPYRIDLSRVVINEVSIIGSRCGPFERALRLLADRRVEIDAMISAEYPLEVGTEAFTRAGDGVSVKLLLAPRR